VHSFRLVNARGQSTFVKFHCGPGSASVDRVGGGLKLQAADNDFHRRDLWEPLMPATSRVEFGVQLFTEAQAAEFPFDHLDPTKLIPEELVPLQMIGRMVLDRNPTTCSRRPSRWRTARPTSCPHRLQQRPAAAGPAVLLPGHAAAAAGWPELSPDPVNAQVSVRASPARRTHADGSAKSRVAYEPSSLDSGSARQPRGRLPDFAQPADEGEKGRVRARVSPITTARRGCSIAASPHRAGAHGLGLRVRALEGGNATRTRSRGGTPAQCGRRTRAARGQRLGLARFLRRRSLRHRCRTSISRRRCASSTA